MYGGLAFRQKLQGKRELVQTCFFVRFFSRSVSDPFFISVVPGHSAT